MTVEKGRPADISGRLGKEIKTSDVFGKLTKALKHEYTIVTLTGG